MGKNSNKNKKLTNDMILQKFSFTFTRDAEWFKRTHEKIKEVKDDMDKKFYTPEKKAQKIDFIRKLQNKLKDYKDAMKFEQKYKGIRFFERRKLERMLKKVNKEIEAQSKEDVEKLKELEEKKKKIVDDINYVKFYPKSYKYYSLFPNNDKDNPETLKKIEKMRKKIAFYVFLIFNNQVNKKGNNNEESDEEEKEDKEGVDNGDETTVKKSENLKSKTKKKTFKQSDNIDYEKETHKKSKNNNNIENDNFFVFEEE